MDLVHEDRKSSKGRVNNNTINIGFKVWLKQRAALRVIQDWCAEIFMFLDTQYHTFNVDPRKGLSQKEIRVFFGHTLIVIGIYCSLH